MTDTAHFTRRAVLILATLMAVIGALWLWMVVSRWIAARPVRAFHSDVDNLFEAFHEYRRHVGQYPLGDNAQIVQALTGNNPKNVIILAVRRESLNPKGEIIDPWGTPLKIYFADDEVLIRSAGPNKAFENGKNATSDDYFRAD